MLTVILPRVLEPRASVIQVQVRWNDYASHKVSTKICGYPNYLYHTQFPSLEACPKLRMKRSK